MDILSLACSNPGSYYGLILAGLLVLWGLESVLIDLFGPGPDQGEEKK